MLFINIKVSVLIEKVVSVLSYRNIILGVWKSGARTLRTRACAVIYLTIRL